MRQKTAEQFGPLARAVRQDLRDKTPVVGVEHRLRDPAEEGKGMDVAIDPSLGHRRWVGAHKTGIAVRQIQREEVRLLRHAANHHHRFAEIRLRVTSSMGKPHNHLSAAPTVFPNVILDRRVAALERVFIPQPLKNPFGGMALLAVAAEILCKPLVDEAGETIQPGPLDLCLAPIARRH